MHTDTTTDTGTTSTWTGTTTQASTGTTTRTYPKRKKREDDALADVSILEYALNPVYRTESESLTAAAISDVAANFDGMDRKSYANLFEILWYKQLPCFDVKGTTSEANNQHGMIKYCEWKGLRIPCSAIFKTAPTDRGMCCTFNLQAAEEMFKDQQYRVCDLDAFKPLNHKVKRFNELYLI